MSRPDSDLLTWVNDSLVAEVELLGDHLPDTRFALFERVARYRVLLLQERLAGQTPEDSLYIIDDDHVCLRERVDSILGGHTWMEQPCSRARRLMGNVRLKRVEGEPVSSRGNFAVHQFRNRGVRDFVGEASHVLRDGPGGLRIVSWEIRPNHKTISAQRRISIIL